MDYFDRTDVRLALHISDQIGPWELCTNGINYTIGSEGSQWIYEALHGKYRMLHYSGDIDGAVPTIGTLGWISTLPYSVAEDWRAYFVNDQVAGYV